MDDRGERSNGFVDSSPLLNDPAALRQRASTDGYLYFRGYLPAEPLMQLRREMLQIVASHGWIRSGSELMDGIINLDFAGNTPAEQMRDDIGVPGIIYDQVQKLEHFHALPHHPKLLELYRTLFGKEVLVHPRHIARMVTSHPAIAPTPPHQDFIHIQGTTNVWTCWFPLSDVPRTMGGLAMLRGSHRQGVIEVAPAPGAGGLATQLCAKETDWVEGDYALGDLITFPSLTVHKALRSKVRDRIRLSMDVRYQPLDEEIESASLRPHCGLEWQDIYRDWNNDEFKYYWEKHDLKLSAWNEILRWQKERICTY